MRKVKSKDVNDGMKRLMRDHYSKVFYNGNWIDIEDFPIQSCNDCE